MKTILLSTLLLLLISCGQGPRPSSPKLEECIEGHEPTCAQLPEVVDVPEEEELPLPMAEEPTPEPVVEPIVEEEEEHKPYYYNHSLYFKKFSFWGFNFVSQDILNKDNQTVFKSTNTTQVPIGSQYKRIYAKILFKNGEKVQIQYINSSTDALEETHERDWLIKDDFEFHIDGYRAGWFGWHSIISPTMKTQNEIDDGVGKYAHTTTEYESTDCNVSMLPPFNVTCVDKYKVTDIYYPYYFD